MVLTVFLGLGGCTAGGAPESECAGGKCDAPNAPGDEGEVQYESGYYDATFDRELSASCEGGEVDPAGLQPGLVDTGAQPPPDEPIRVVRLRDAMRLEGEPCETDGPSFRCVGVHEIDELDEGATFEIEGAVEGEWTAPDVIAGRAGIDVSCTGEQCDLFALDAGLIGPEGEPRSFPCFFGWSFEAEHIGHKLPESE